MKISYSFGIMDLIHVGHIHALAEAKKDADLHIFGLVNDNAIIEWNGQLISSFEERRKTLESIVFVDEVMLQETFDPSSNLKKIHKMYPDAEITLCHGNDWKFLPVEEFLKSINGKIKLTPYYDRLSPANILKQLQEQSQNRPSFNNIVSTKANTLLALREKISKSTIEDIFITTGNEFLASPNSITKKIQERFKGKKIVVRSSSSHEDGFVKSNAGFYESVLNVNADNSQEIAEAINIVASSYKKDSGSDYETGFEQILIQSQTEDIAFSGVVFTRDVQKNRPYYLINYDDNGSTDSVTSGIGGKSLWITHDVKMNSLETTWKDLITAVKEIENVLSGIILDIEFAIKKSGEIVIFQVRPLAASYKFKKHFDEEIFFKALNKEKERYFAIKDAFKNKPMMWSDMAFWNPAEIIGTNPKTLDFSLYKEIITSRCWNEGLIPMGYKNVDHNLMRRFANKPFISLDYSFRSLIPNVLSEKLTDKLVDFYLNKLRKNIKSHDKIEFEIVLSCFDFETKEKLKELLENGFSKDEVQEIEKALHSLTSNAVNNFFNVLANDKKDLYKLELTKQKIEKELKNSSEIMQLIEYFKILISELKLNGTPHFSRQARYAFIAKSFCRTLVSKGFIHSEAMESFMLSIDTVASEFSKDINLYLDNKISKYEFDLKYGHLRSGTYDITSECYANIDFKNESAAKVQSHKTLQSSNLDINIVEQALKSIEMNVEAEQFINFLKTAYEQRELFKFEFTKTLSLAIEILARMGELIGFTREDMSYLDVADIYSSVYYPNSYDLKEFWTTIINQRKDVHKFNSQIILPNVILDENSFNIIKIEEMRPNFITEKTISAETIVLENNKKAEIEGKIVLIERADPGFDWIFSKNIKGLITMYGGVASHMAIRCSEFGLPAAIGCGEKIYADIMQMENITLDCKNGKITGKALQKCAV